MSLRAYQQRAVDQLRDAYRSGKRAPICVLPTGAGKTHVGAEIARLTVQRGRHLGFVVPRIELLAQAVAKLAESGITDVRTIQAQNGTGREDAPVFVASMQTLTQERWMANPPKADLLIIDEAHHGKAETYEQFIRLYSSSLLLGLSATPERGDGRALDIFDSLVVGSTVRELTALGHLVPCRVYAPPQVLQTRELAMEPLHAYRKYCSDTKCIVFAQTVNHARELAREFTACGIPAKWITAESKNREEILQEFREEQFRVLVNVSIFVEGYDDPGIASCILARRFTHVGPFLQALGRTLRPFPGKSYSTAVDLCGSALVHGTPDLERVYSLTGKGIAKPRATIRQCQECGGVFEDRPRCPYCSFATPPLKRDLPRSKGVGVEEVTAQTPRSTWLPKIVSKFTSTCSRCHQRIAKGDLIIYDKSQPKHLRARHSLCPLRSEPSKEAA